MALTRDEGIVLRLSDYSETSQIVTLLTQQHGQVRLIAKGARRATKARPSVGLDLLEIGQMTFQPARGDAGLGTLGEWKQQSALLGLRRDLLTLHTALYAAESTRAVTSEHDPCPEIFESFRLLLRSLAGENDAEAAPAADATIDAPAGTAALLLKYEAGLLKEIGYAPSLRQCVICQKPRKRGAPAWFSSTAGGLVCADCQGEVREKHSIKPELLDAARGTTRPEEWLSILDYHLTHLIGQPLESARPLFDDLRQRGAGPPQRRSE